MATIVLDSSSAETLRKCDSPAVLRDAQGTIVGYFQPVRPTYDPRDIPEFDEAELDRREQRWQGLPGAEVRRQLENLR
jgi:hypothetical protein